MLYAKSISFVLFFVFLFASPLFANPSDIVVKIQAVRNPPSYHQPWQNLGHRSVNGSGIIVDGGRILTNAHVVANSVFIHVQKAGKTEKYPAEVEFFGHASDLALLRVDDADFFKGIKTLPFGQLPQVRDKVAVYGFPDGGDKLSITEGVVSRIEHISYAYSGAYLLACQIDASINSGNSGGPVVYENQIAGIAFQGMNFNYENIGYMIPTSVIRQFLDDAEDGDIEGVPDLALTMQKLESVYLRRYYRMQPGEDGALINKVLPGSTAEGLLYREDIIMAVEKQAVAYDGTIVFNDNMRTYFGYLYQNKQVGQSVLLSIKRRGENVDIRIPLGQPVGVARLVRLEFAKKPKYYIVGGLVFQPLTMNYLQEFGSGNWVQSAPVELTNYAVNGELDFQGKEIVILAEVLADKVNVGYHELGDNVVRQVDGVPVNNFEHFIALVETATSEYVEIIVNRGTKVVVDRRDVFASTKRILDKFAIGSARDQH
jgi:S1-C subfamily serine protease